MKFNELIFNELLKRGCSSDGQTRTWDITDSKLWYITSEQSQAYLNLDQDGSYKRFTGQEQWKTLVNQNIEEMSKEIGSGGVNAVDLGCGNGLKTAYAIKELTVANPNLKVRYCPVDISRYMVSKAMENFSKLGVCEIVKFEWNVSDFENLKNITGLLKENEYKKNVIFFLGNTLDNFETNHILGTINTAMGKEDLLVIDTAINDHNQDKRVDTYVHSKSFNEWLIHIPLQLGMNREDVEFGGHFKRPRIELYYSVKNGKEIEYQNKKVQFMKGDRIIVVAANKYEKEEMENYLKTHFSYISTKISDDNSKILALCKK